MQAPFCLQTFAPIDDAPALSDWLSEQARLHPDQRLHALLDGAQIEGLPSNLKKLAPQSCGSLFGILGKHDVETAGCWLVDVDVNAGQASRCLNMCCDEALAHPAVVWLQSPLGLHELLQLLAHRMDAKLKRGPEAFFRYYDPRIFTNLVKALKPEQAPFLSMASRWYWFDHAFKRCILDVSLDVEAACRFATPCEIDQDQENILIEGSLPFEVMKLLDEDDPEALEAIPLKDRYALIKQGVDKTLAKGQRSLLAMVEACGEILAATTGAANGH